MKKWVIALIIALCACAAAVTVVIMFSGSRDNGDEIYEPADTASSPGNEYVQHADDGYVTVTFDETAMANIVSKAVPESIEDISVDCADGALTLSATAKIEPVVAEIEQNAELPSVVKFAVGLLPEKAKLGVTARPACTDGEISLTVDSFSVGGVKISGSLLPQNWLDVVADEFENSLNSYEMELRDVEVAENGIKVILKNG